MNQSEEKNSSFACYRKDPGILRAGKGSRFETPNVKPVVGVNFPAFRSGSRGRIFENAAGPLFRGQAPLFSLTFQRKEMPDLHKSRRALGAWQCCRLP